MAEIATSPGGTNRCLFWWLGKKVKFHTNDIKSWFVVFVGTAFKVNVNRLQVQVSIVGILVVDLTKGTKGQILLAAQQSACDYESLKGIPVELRTCHCTSFYILPSTCWHNGMNESPPCMLFMLVCAGHAAQKPHLEYYWLMCAISWLGFWLDLSPLVSY